MEFASPSIDLTAEKLALMKLNATAVDSDILSEQSTLGVGHGHSHSLSNGHHSASKSLARTSRQVSRSSTKRSSSFISSHRNKMSMELTSQAETKFLALMELITSASREASSLKEFWSRIVSEREAFAQEREELMEQITEVTQELEQRENDYHRHGNEAVERKKQIEKLLVELSVAIGNVSAEKKKLAERDHQLERTRHELHELRETYTRTHGDYEKFRSELDSIQLLLKTAEGDRDGARDEADRYHRELLKLTRERTEISSKLTDITSKHELSRKEVMMLTDRINMYDLEREEHHHELDRVKEDARKARLRVDESAKELLDITEKYDRVERETHKLRDTIRIIESERDEHTHTTEHLRREIKVLTTARDDAEERCSDVNIKYEHIKRELLSIKEKLRDIELERNEIQESYDRTREQHRLIIIERDELKDEVGTATRKADDYHRRLIVLTESLRKSESTLSDVRSEIYTLTERIKALDRERDEYRHKNGHLHPNAT